MTREDGIRQIDNAQWQHDDPATLDLWVNDSEGHAVHCWLTMRPVYCDRGHIQLNIDGALSLNLDRQDSFPRFFFSFEEADAHTRTFLKWRLWRERTHSHGEVLAGFNAAVTPKKARHSDWSGDDFRMPGV
jgi:hypothetical protein